MSPKQASNDVWVSDEETDLEADLSLSHGEQTTVPILKPQKKCLTWRERLMRLGRVGIRGNARPPVGQLCLVMVGSMVDEQGQLGIVTRQASCMVEVAVRPVSGARTVSHMKRPSSLILLEPGLVLVQEKNGSVWIRHNPDEI